MRYDEYFVTVHVPYSALPVVVRRRFDELAPVLAFYKASVSHD